MFVFAVGEVRLAVKTAGIVIKPEQLVHQVQVALVDGIAVDFQAQFLFFLALLFQLLELLPVGRMRCFAFLFGFFQCQVFGFQNAVFFIRAVGTDMGEKHIGLFELEFDVECPVAVWYRDAGSFFDVKIVAGIFAQVLFIQVALAFFKFDIGREFGFKLFYQLLPNLPDIWK